MLQGLARFLGKCHQVKQVTLLLGLSSLCFQSEGQEQAGREAASGEVEQMPSLWLPQVALQFCGGWRQADLPLSGGKGRHLWEEGMLLDLLHREHSPVPSQDKVAWDVALIEIQRVKQPLVNTATGSNMECFSAWVLFCFVSFSLLTPPCCFSLGSDPNLKCVSFFSSSPHQVLYHSPNCGHKTRHSPCACGTKHCAPHRAQPRHSLCSLGYDD